MANMLRAAGIAFYLASVVSGMVHVPKESREFDALWPTNPKKAGYMTTADGKFPDDISSITLCMWIKMAVLDKNMCVFSYCAPKPTEDCNDLALCLQPYQESSQLYVGNYFIRVTNPIFLKDVWQHVCVLFDGVNQKVNLTWNGYNKYETYSKDSIEKLGAGYKLKGKGKIVIGQDQDTYGGGFESGHGMRGWISRMQLWDKVLDDGEIVEQLKCNAPEGNIMAWTQTEWEFKDGCTKEEYEPCPAKDTCSVEEAKRRRSGVKRTNELGLQSPNARARRVMKIFNGTASYLPAHGATHFSSSENQKSRETTLRISSKTTHSKKDRSMAQEDVS